MLVRFAQVITTDNNSVYEDKCIVSNIWWKLKVKSYKWITLSGNLSGKASIKRAHEFKMIVCVRISLFIYFHLWSILLWKDHDSSFGDNDKVSISRHTCVMQSHITNS